MSNIDTYGHARAQALAARITAYWRQRGYTVETWIVAESAANDNAKGGILYGVRSNLVNGVPPRRDVAA